MPRGPRLKFSIEELARALEATGGIAAAAAAKLNEAEEAAGGVRRITGANIRHHAATKPRLIKLRQDLEENTMDLAEGAVLGAILAGDATIALRYLELKGRSRGYERSTSLNGKWDLSRMSIETLDSIIHILRQQLGRLPAPTIDQQGNVVDAAD